VLWQFCVLGFLETENEIFNVEIYSPHEKTKNGDFSIFNLFAPNDTG
jgi:hypothetical protein